MSKESSKKTRKASCDSCKASRVLCLGRDMVNTNEPCPRCVAKGISCTTTPVVRKRAHKRYELPTPTSGGNSPAEDEQPQNSNRVISHASARLGKLQLQIGTLRRLIAEFEHLPQYSQPILPLSNIQEALERCSYRLDRLAAPMRVVAHAIFAVSALGTADPSILGTQYDVPHLHRTALITDHTGAVTMVSEDLRPYGHLRASICRELKELAFDLAKEEGVTVDCSQENAASCMLLEFLESRNRPMGTIYSRSYASAGVAHIRALADAGVVFSNEKPGDNIRWAAFWMSEALSSTVEDRPISFTISDEHALFGNANLMSLNELCTWLSTPSTQPGANRAIETVAPCVARRVPVDETVFDRILNELAAMRQVLELLVYHSFSAPVSDFMALILARISYSLSVTLAVLYLPLYREISRRLEVAATAMPDGSTPPPPPPAALAARVRHATFLAATLLAERARDAQLCLLTHVPFNALEEWCQILLAEGECAKAAGIDRTPHLQWMIQSLKRAGWANIEKSGTTATAEMQVQISERIANERLVDAIWDPAWEQLMGGSVDVPPGLPTSAPLEFDPGLNANLWGAGPFMDV